MKYSEKCTHAAIVGVVGIFLPLFLLIIGLGASTQLRAEDSIESPLWQFGVRRCETPNRSVNFDWPAKRNVLLGYYEPTDDEKRFIAESSPKPIFAGPVNHRRLRVLYRCQYSHTSIATSNHAYQQIALWSGVFGVDFSDDPANALLSRQYRKDFEIEG